KIFKELADHLKIREAERQKLFPRKMDEELLKELEDDSKEVYFEASLFDLINAFTKALNRFRESPVYEVTQEDFTVEQKIHDILHALLREPRALLTEFFVHTSSKLEVIVTFMAILELIRLRE
ncbi:MAG: segregation/condensation protein A, partial [Candidatus Omnitrophota bacterium]